MGRGFRSAGPCSPGGGSCVLGAGRERGGDRSGGAAGAPASPRGFKFPPARGCATARGAGAAGASENRQSP